MNRSTVVVTIGRNIGNNPMRAESWRVFRLAVAKSFELVGAQMLQYPNVIHVTAGDQIGEWQGKREGAATFVAIVDNDKLDELRRFVNIDREQFMQDAVGFIVAAGDSHLLV